MSESAEVKLSQNASNSDLVENGVIIEANGDHSSDPNVVPTIRPDVDNCIESKTIECGDNSESEQDFATTVVNRVTQLNGITMDGVNGMRSIDADATQVPDVCSGSRHIDDGVDGMREEPSQDSNTAQSASESICGSDNEVIVIETVVKTESNEVTLITDTTIKTTINENSNQSITDSQNNNNIDKNNDSNNLNNNKSETMTTTTSRPKQLKGLLKKGVKTNGERKRVKFSETMQVFCDDWPQNLMPQIIALKSPTDFNLVEVQGYMFEPPVEYQDFLPFDPPPDYRDLIANSLCAFDNDLSINYIDDEEDDDNTLLKSNIKSEQKFLNEFSSKWESMILNNNESLEEEQIIGVLKEDAILQAIGSHISLPEENLCPEDFPIHFPNNKTSESNIKLAESELSDITSDDGNDSSPTGSLQDIQSDSSITSQDTIILINTDSNDNNDNFEVYSNKSIFNEINTKNSEDISYQKNSDCVVNCQSKSENRSTKSDQLNDSFEIAMNSKTNESLNCEEPNEQNIECDSVKRVSAEEEEEEEEVVSSPDVTHNIDKKDVKTNEIHENESNAERKPTDSELNSEQKQINLFTNEESNELRSNHSNSFRRNLQFYENMFSNNINKSDNTSDGEKQQKQSHRVSHFFIQNNPKYPVITQTISNNINDNNVKQFNESSVEIKQNSNQVFENSSNSDNCPPMAPTRAPTQQTSHTQPNSNNWSADEFIIEYTSEPKALVPSKRTASLSNFATAQMSNNLQILRNNPNISNNNQYLSLNRNGEIPKQWNAYNMDSHNNSSQVLYPNQNPPIQRSLSPNPPMVSASMRPVSPQQTVYYQNRPQYTPRYPPTHTMPVHVMYNQMSGLQPLQQRLSVRLPIMTQTLGPPHKKPPPYHYHIQQHNNEFPNPSEIRRRDGLNAYPHILNQMPTAGALPVPPIHHNNSNNQTPPQNALPQNLTKDELEQFVQQDIQRTERIKKRYSMTEEDDPSFGFARRPSVRGIRPKFESTTEILKQMQTPNNSAVGSQMAGSHTSWPQNSYSNNNQQMSNTLPKKPHIVQIRFQPQNPMSVKYMNETPESTQSSQVLHSTHTKTMSGQQTSRTLPRPSSLISQSQMNAIRSEDGFVIRLPANVSRDQLKQQIQRQIEQQFQSKAKQKTNSSSMPSNAKPMMSSNDERGAPEGASSSPKHSSDLLFAKNLSSNSNTNVKSTETTANRQQTNDTKKLVINPENNTNSETTNENQSQGVIYYAMNV